MQKSLGRESFAWAVGSSCALHRIPFDVELLLRRFPPPYNLASLQQAAQAYDFKVALEALPVQTIHPASFPVIVVLKPKSQDNIACSQQSAVSSQQSAVSSQQSAVSSQQSAVSTR